MLARLLEAATIYDTFALRDSEGHGAIMQTWPYFRSYKSRTALKYTNPVPLSSCWAEMMFIRTEPSHNKKHSLRFPGVEDSSAKFHLEGSECCLIHQDNPFTAKRKVFVNPHLRVSYNKEAYELMNGPQAT